MPEADGRQPFDHAGGEGFERPKQALGTRRGSPRTRSASSQAAATPGPSEFLFGTPEWMSDNLLLFHFPPRVIQHRRRPISDAGIKQRRPGEAATRAHIALLTEIGAPPSSASAAMSMASRQSRRLWYARLL